MAKIEDRLRAEGPSYTEPTKKPGGFKKRAVALGAAVVTLGGGLVAFATTRGNENPAPTRTPGVSRTDDNPTPPTEASPSMPEVGLPDVAVPNSEDPQELLDQIFNNLRGFYLSESDDQRREFLENLDIDYAIHWDKWMASANDPQQDKYGESMTAELVSLETLPNGLRDLTFTSAAIDGSEIIKTWRLLPIQDEQTGEIAMWLPDFTQDFAGNS